MIKIIIWGIGIKRITVEKAVNLKKCEIVGYIDNNPQKQGKFVNKIPVYSILQVPIEYDYLVISVKKYDSILYQLESLNFDMNKVIVYFRENEFNNDMYCSFININLWRIDLLEEKVKKLENIINLRLNNLKYELNDVCLDKNICLPNIGNTEEAIDKITKEGSSLVRFGDGEFEIMAGKERAVFQNYNPLLAKRLLEIVKSNNSKLLIAIANNYGSLEQYTEEVADGIREYMTDDVRKFHLSILNMKKVYYDAYMFKCYYPYKDKKTTQKRVEQIKKIWNQRDVVLIEGDKTRTGYENDLLDNANSIKRILAPTKNAFDKYDEIFEEALKLPPNALILITLGPAGKVLTYDLFNKGYQVIDIGQVDMDYDWYKAGANTKLGNSKKYISQLPEAMIEDVNDLEYLNQIIAKIE